jgi:signal transduction histidine kinase
LATPLGTISLKLNRLARKKEFNEEDISIALSAVKQCEQSIKFLSKSVATFDTEIESEINLNDLVNDCFIKANKIVLAQTLIDLIDNAIYFSKNKLISIKCFETDNFFNLEIANTGSQFSKIVIEKIGEPFLSIKENGNGLGLFNAYNFMLACNGSLTIENRDNDTAVVAMRFPR